MPTSSEPVIRAVGLGKQYRRGERRPDYATLRDAIARWWARPLLGRHRGKQTSAFWALRDVSFEVARGEVLGIIGRNGAGKSTLLRVLSRITVPTEGFAEVRGRVGSLLEVGTGFHPELTGRENIYLNGAILGMTHAEVNRRFDAIVAFAEVDAFVDTPVKRYSSGMFLRLAFAVAAHFEPEVLLVDEVLAVGDAAFQRRCLGKMSEVARTGRTILFVSHNMAAVRSLCTRALVLDSGAVRFQGPVAEALTLYAGAGTTDAGWARGEDPPAPGPLTFERIDSRLHGESPEYRLELELWLHSRSQHRPAFIAVDISDATGVPIMQALPSVQPFVDPQHPWHHVRIDVDLPWLVPGRYCASPWVGPHNTQTFDFIDRAVAFEIHVSPTPARTFPHTPDHGFVVPPARVNYEPASQPPPGPGRATGKADA